MRFSGTEAPSPNSSSSLGFQPLARAAKRRREHEQAEKSSTSTPLDTNTRDKRAAENNANDRATRLPW